MLDIDGFTHSFLEDVMAGKKKGPDVWVVKSKTQPGKFVVKEAGAEKPLTRPATQTESIEKAKPIADRNQSDLVVQGRDGKIRSKDSHGSDPVPPKDREH